MNETLHFPNSTQNDPQTLEREIDRTRADMDRTLGALEKKLSPSHWVEEAMDYLRAHGSGMADGNGHTDVFVRVVSSDHTELVSRDHTGAGISDGLRMVGIRFPAGQGILEAAAGGPLPLAEPLPEEPIEPPDDALAHRRPVVHPDAVIVVRGVGPERGVPAA